MNLHYTTTLANSSLLYVRSKSMRVGVSGCARRRTTWLAPLKISSKCVEYPGLAWPGLGCGIGGAGYNEGSKRTRNLNQAYHMDKAEAGQRLKASFSEAGRDLPLSVAGWA